MSLFDAVKSESEAEKQWFHLILTVSIAESALLAAFATIEKNNELPFYLLILVWCAIALNILCSLAVLSRPQFLARWHLFQELEALNDKQALKKTFPEGMPNICGQMMSIGFARSLGNYSFFTSIALIILWGLTKLNEI